MPVVSPMEYAGQLDHCVHTQDINAETTPQLGHRYQAVRDIFKNVAMLDVPWCGDLLVAWVGVDRFN